jgi:hypothetical protein
MMTMCRFITTLLLIVGIPQLAHAQALSRESLARAVREMSHQIQAAPIARRGPNRAPSLLPILVGAGIGGGFGVWVAHRSEAPVAMPISMAAFGATIGYIISSR